tara:strand:+ start:325 stop:2982 length:2658 start_codon:yes stop_codon:yes gene_type:complete
MLDKFNNSEKSFSNVKKTFREKLKRTEDQFFLKNNGTYTSKQISEAFDYLISNLFSLIARESKFNYENLVICAVGGYGRKEMAPFSDIDLIIVPENEKKGIEIIIKKLLYQLWDMGLKVGYSVRDIYSIKKINNEDLTTQTALLDARKIIGGERLFCNVKKILKSNLSKEKNKIFIDLKNRERIKKLNKNEDKSYLLEPNIKESLGGLRDLNTIFWIFKTINKTSNLEILYKKNVISDLEKNKLRKSLDFILTLRIYMHYLSKRANDKLTFDLQYSIANIMKYRAKDNNLKVERLMRHYFLNVRNIRNLMEYITQVAFLYAEKKEYSKQKIFTKGAVIEENCIKIINKKLFLNNAENFINIFLDVDEKNLQIHPETYRFLYHELSKVKIQIFQKKKILEKFKKILISNSGSKVLYTMNDSGVLEKIIPQFRNIIAMSQFDLYHLYTVDEHILKALILLKKINSIEKVSSRFELARSILRSQNNKKVIFFSILLHDIGKGLKGDHCQRGVEIANEISKQFNFNKNDSLEIAWLIENHLMFSHYAFKKDLEEESVIEEFVKKVSTVKRLECLYLLTVVDIASVNNSSLNDWATRLLKRLYNKTLDSFKKPFLYKYNILGSNRLTQLKRKVFLLLEHQNKKKFNQFSTIVDESFWFSQSIKSIANQISTFFDGQRLKKKFDYRVDFNKINGVFNVTIATYDRKKLLLDFVQNFAFNQLEVLEARIFTLKNKVVIDKFKLSVKSPRNFDKQDLERKKLRLLLMLKNINYNNPISQKRNIVKDQSKNLNILQKISLRKFKIKFINEMNFERTCISISAMDRPFLLFDIIRIFFVHNLIVDMAKISTVGGIVEDTFYVHKSKGSKLLKNNEIKKIKFDLQKKLMKRKSFVF